MIAVLIALGILVLVLWIVNQLVFNPLTKRVCYWVAVVLFLIWLLIWGIEYHHFNI